MRVQYRGIGHAVKETISPAPSNLCYSREADRFLRENCAAPAFTPCPELLSRQRIMEVMPLHSVSPLYAAAELRAYEHRTNHAFVQAASSAHEAAEIARSDGDVDAWWNMTFFQAENLLDAEEFEACAALASDLVDGPHSTMEPQAKALTYILVAKARQGAGLLEEAADAARAASLLVTDDDDVEIHVKARQALIAALADSGRLDEAWAEMSEYWPRWFPRSRRPADRQGLLGHRQRGIPLQQGAGRARLSRARGRDLFPGKEPGRLGEIQQGVRRHAARGGRRRRRHLALHRTGRTGH